MKGEFKTDSSTREEGGGGLTMVREDGNIVVRAGVMLSGVYCASSWVGDDRYTSPRKEGANWRQTPPSGGTKLVRDCNTERVQD